MAQTRHDTVMRNESLPAQMRKAVAADEAFVLALEERLLRSCYQTSGRRFVPRPGMDDDFPHNCQIVRVDGEDVGCLTATVSDDLILIDQMYLLPAYQHRGIGGSILSSPIASATESGRKIRATVPSAPGSTTFFLANGFGIRSENTNFTTLEWTSSTQHRRFESTDA